MTWWTKVFNTNIQIAGSDIDLGDVGLRDATDREINPALRSAQSDVISDLQLIDANLVQLQSDVLLIDANSTQTQSDIQLIDASVKVVGSDVRLVDASTKVGSSDTRLVDASVKVNSSDVRLVNSDTRSINTRLGTTGAAASRTGSQSAQLRYLGDNISQVNVMIDELSATATWAASTDAAGITQEADHVPEYSVGNSLSIDKTGTTVTEASYGKTITSIDASALSGTGNMTFFTSHANYTNVASVFIRLGTDASNYATFSIDPVDFTVAVWGHISIALHQGVTTGTGLDLDAVTYIAFGVIMDAAANTITDIKFNTVALHSVSETELSVSGDVTSNAVRVSSVGSPAGGNWPKDAGNSSNATPRVVLATDDINTAAINSDTKLISSNTEGIQSDVRLVYSDTKLISTNTGNLSQTNSMTSKDKLVEQISYVAISQYGSGAGSDTLGSETGSSHWHLMGFYGTMSDAGTLQFREEDGSPVYGGAISLLASTPFVLPVTGLPYLVTADSKGFQLITTGSAINGSAQVLEVAD